MKAPRARFDSPVKTAIVFISDTQPDPKKLTKYDNMSQQEFSNLKKEVDGECECMPVCFLDAGDSGYSEAPLHRPVIAKYITVKLLTAAKKNFDVEFLGFVGTCIGIPTQSVTLKTDISTQLDIQPSSLEDVGNNLGVKKRVKRFEYRTDYDKNGLLYWIGTNENEIITSMATWTNPVVSAQVGITTSHAMYSVGMNQHDIIGREGGTSCYWGSSCPQFFLFLI